LCLKRLFSCTVYQCVSRRSQVGLKPCGFEAWFRSRRCGYVVGLAPQGVGGGPSLCLPPGRGAGLSLKTPLNTPARHCGGTPVRRRRTDAPRRGREPLSLRLLAEVHRDAGPPLEPWILRLASAAEADSRVRDLSSMQRPMCAFWQLAETPGGDAVGGGGEDATEPSGTAAGGARLLCAASGAAGF